MDIPLRTNVAESSASTNSKQKSDKGEQTGKKLSHLGNDAMKKVFDLASPMALLKALQTVINLSDNPELKTLPEICNPKDAQGILNAICDHIDKKQGANAVSTEPINQQDRALLQNLITLLKTVLSEVGLENSVLFINVQSSEPHSFGESKGLAGHDGFNTFIEWASWAEDQLAAVNVQSAVSQVADTKSNSFDEIGTGLSHKKEGDMLQEFGQVSSNEVYPQVNDPPSRSPARQTTSSPSPPITPVAPLKTSVEEGIVTDGSSTDKRFDINAPDEHSVLVDVNSVTTPEIDQTKVQQRREV